MIEHTKSPTGWGYGYKNIDFINCWAEGNKIACELSEMGSRDKEVLVGTELHLEELKVRVLPFPPSTVFATTKGREKAMCYLDTGMIVCRGED